MKNFMRGLFVFFVGVSLAGAYTISGKIANWDPDTSGSFLVTASTNPNSPGTSISAFTNVTCASGASAAYTLTVNVVGNYYIFGLLDLNSNMVPDPNEPRGEYAIFNSTTGAEAVAGGMSDVSNIDFVCRSQEGPYFLRGLVRSTATADISGAVVKYESYSSPHDTNSLMNYTTFTNTVFGDIVSSVNPDYIPTYNWSMIIDPLVTGAVGYDGEYQRIVVSSSNYIPGEQWIYFSTNTESGKFFNTVLAAGGTAPPAGGSISGQIHYTGTATGNLYIAVDHGDPSTWTTALYQNNEGIVSFIYDYATSSTFPTASDYYISAFIDVDGNGIPDSSTEPTGQFGPISVTDGVSTPNIIFSISDPAPPSGVTINLDVDGYDFSANTTAAWGSGADIVFSSGVFTAGVNELEVYNLDIYDAGTGWSDVASVDTFDNSGTGAGHIEPVAGNYYTFKDVDGYETVIKITAVSATSVTFEFNYDYMPATDNYSYYGTYTGIPVTLENISVTSSNGDDVISPNNDGNDDELQLNYVVKSTDSAILTGGGANIKIVVDTNGNGVADVFKWEQVMWEDNAPHYIPATAISTSSIYYNPNGNDWWGYFSSLTQDEKDALKISYARLNALQSLMDYDFWDWIDQSEFTEVTNGVYKTGMRNVSINFSMDWLKRIPENGSCKIFVEAAAPYYSPQTVSDSTTTAVTVEDVAKIYGRVTLPDGSGASYAEISAGNQSSWSNTFSGKNGWYVIKGLAKGTYHMEAGKAGFVKANAENVFLSSTIARQDFQLGKGVKVKATVTLPEPFAPYIDEWGNTVTEMWGWVNAWSVNSADGGWENFRISSGASSAEVELPLVKGIYNISAGADKYISVSTTVVLQPSSENPKGVLAEGATSYALAVGLKPSVNITGYIVVPTTSTVDINQQWIDINARSADNSAWAWGQRDNNQGSWNIFTSSTSIPFKVYNVVPDKTYILSFHSQYYAEQDFTVDVGSYAVVLSTPVVMDAGETISGNIVINWTPATYAIYENQAGTDGSGNKTIWLNLDAFNEQTRQGKNIGLSVPISSLTSVSVPYVLAGLSSGMEYQLNIWGLDQGFEQADRWAKVTAPATKNIVFSPFSGRITGVIRAVSGAAVSSDTISISYRMLNQGNSNTNPVLHPSATGWFSIDELKTGEYMVTIQEVDPATQLPAGNYGLIQKRAEVQNAQTTALGNIMLTPAASITGTLLLNSSKYPTWDDVYNASTQTYYTYDNMMNPTPGPPMDIFVNAISVKQMRMGGDPMDSALKTKIKISTSNPKIASFTIGGLSEGSYIVVPPLYFDPSNDGQGNMFGGMYSPNADLASTIPMVPVVTGEPKDIGQLKLIDGVKVKGTVQRSETGVEGHYWVQLLSRQNYMPVSPGKPIDFVDYSKFGITSMASTLNNPSQSFSFTSVYPGKYNVKIDIWNESYKDAVVSFEIPEGSTKAVDLGTIMLEKGANIKGVLRDKDTGSVVYDGIKVRCQSIPWQEGTYRETRNYNDSWADADIKISSTTGAFKLKNLPAGTYRVDIEYGNSDLSYGYVTKHIVGVIVPDSTADVDLGTIDLVKGGNISGVVKDASGNAVPNIKVKAAPMIGESHEWSDYRTDAEGRFVIKGLEPGTSFWKLIAAPRPDAWERWEDTSYYAPTVKKNVVIGSTGNVIVVTLPDASIKGVVETPVLSSKEEMELTVPEGFSGGEAGLKQYGTFMVLQRAGEIYSDPFAGFQIMTKAPFWQDGRWKSSFTITGIKKGKYNMRLVANNFCSEYYKGLDISTGTYDMGAIVLSTGSTLSGIFTKSDGSKVKTTEVQMAVAANQDMTDIVFGRLDSNDSTKEINGYSITGLKEGETYSVVLPLGDNGDNLFIAPQPQKITSASQTYDFTFADNPPMFMSWLKRSSNTVSIEAFANEPLRESDASDVVILDGVYDVNGSTVAGSFNNVTLASDKKTIEARFTFSGAQNSIKYHFEGTDLNGNKQSPDDWTGNGAYPFSYTFYKAWSNYAQTNINPTFGGSVDMGNGDDSGVYVPTGSMDTNEDVKVTVSKTDFPAAASSVGTGATGTRSASAIKAFLAKRNDYFVKKYGQPMPALSGDLLPGTTASALYEVQASLVSGPLASIAAGQTVSLTFSFNTLGSTHPATDLFYVYASTAENNAEWSLVDSAPEINDTDNTITVQTSHFTYFAVYKLSSVPQVTITNPTVTSVSPASGAKGETISSMTIVGTGFKSGANVSFAPVGVSVTSTTLVSSTKIVAWNVVVAASAVSGARSVRVTNSDNGYGTLEDAFYVSSSSTTVSISSVTVSGNANPGQTVNLIITGTGLDNFTDEASDVIKLDNSSAGYFLTGSVVSSTSTSITERFIIFSSAPVGTYDLHLIDNSGEYAYYAAALVITANPYTGTYKSYVFPNPCSANSISIKVCVPGSATDVSNAATVNGAVRIYTLGGELVRTLSASLGKAYGPGDTDPTWANKNVITWDLKNGSGQKVSSGVYFYIVEVAGQGRTSGKIAIIR